ncbi:MAG: hypothetical protein ACXVPL_11420 [Actinomycetota bacterium]
MRHEHRTLPVLIALGVLLGAGLALASPAGHRAHDGRPTAHVTRSASPSPSATFSPTSSPSPAASGSAPEAQASACTHRAATPGWAAGQPPLAHAIHVLASSCGGTHGKGLQTAIEHVQQSAERHAGDTHAGGTGSTHRQEPGTHETGRGGHTTQTGHAGGDTTSGHTSTGSDSGTSGTTGGVDVVHGKGKDGQHGNDVRTGDTTTSGSGGSSSGSSGSDPGNRGSSGDHGAGAGKRPDVPLGPAR